MKGGCYVQVWKENVLGPQHVGLYFPSVTVTDNQGNVSTETTLVNVFWREEMDALLTSKWEGMKGALSQGCYFNDFSKSRL